MEEREAVEALVEDMPNEKKEELMYLYEEYLSLSSPEARFVYRVSKLETLLQAYEFTQSRTDYKPTLKGFWDHTKEKLAGTDLEQFLQELQFPDK